MKERINWIDWAKSIAITLVVMGHTPMEHGHPLIVFINSFHMPFFMFLSGYLTKRQNSFSENWKKDWTSIIIPYLLYNIIFYPYWAIHEYSIGSPITIDNYLFQPAIGIITGSIIGSNTNGPTWFLIALLFSRIIIDIGNRLRHKYIFYFLTAILLLSFYEVNEYYLFTDKLALSGFARCFPYYLIGYLLHGTILPLNYSKKKLIGTTILLGGISITLSFFIYDISSFVLRILIQQVVCISAIIFFTGISLILNPIKSNIIINISIGTMVIFGLHWAFIGSFNQLFQHLLGITRITYSPWQVIVIALIIEALLYPLIKKLPPIWLEKTTNYITK